MKILKRLTLLSGIVLVLLFLLGEGADKILSQHFAGINSRLRQERLTAFDKTQCRLLYNSLIYVGGLAYPEAADILHHYIYGHGQDLYLQPDYLQQSPVVQKQLQNMKVGEVRKVRLKQSEDWRLSYAVNGFTLKKNKKSVQLFQYIVFSKDQRIVTNLNLYFFKVRIPDGLIHVLNPSPFKAYSEWRL